MVQFSRPKSGTVIVGRHVGSTKPGVYPSVEPGSTAYRHDVESFQELWDEIGKESGTRWSVEGTTMDEVGLQGFGDPKKRPHWWEPNMRRMLFTVRRL